MRILPALQYLSRTMLLGALLTVLLFATSPIRSVYALSNDDLKSIINNTSNYGKDPCGDNASIDASDNGGNLAGSDNMEKAFNYFTGKGLSPLIAAAIVGNFVQESNVNPKQSGGYMAQWGGDRLNNLNRFAAEKNQSVTSLGLQLDFVSTELRIIQPPQDIPVGDYSATLKSTQEQSDVSAATGYFMGTYPLSQYPSMHGEADQATVAFVNKYGPHPGYEGPSLPELGNRINDAKQILTMYGNGQAAATNLANDPASTDDSVCSSADKTGGAVAGSGSGNFTTDNSVNYPGLQEMLSNVNRAAEPNSNKRGPKTISNTAVCGSSSCLGTCMHTMAALWGYPSSGYSSPYVSLGGIKSMWNALEGTNYKHPGNRNVPVGALLIYSGSPGHVVIYLGDNLIVSTDTGPDGSFVSGGGIHVVSADSIEKKWGMNYLGWADPVFGGHLGYGSVHY